MELIQQSEKQKNILDVYHRRVKSGYMLLQLEKYNQVRTGHLFCKDNLKRKDLERRLCGTAGYKTHDICRLYVSFYHAGYGCSLRERIDVEDMRPQEEIDWLLRQEMRTNPLIIRFNRDMPNKQKAEKFCLRSEKRQSKPRRNLRKKKKAPIEKIVSFTLRSR